MNSDPLPILRFLWGEDSANFDVQKPDLWDLREYPWECAIRADFIPLVQFLLDHGGALPLLGWFAIKAAIRKKDLKLVKMLIEFDVKPGTRNKAIVQDFLVDMAIECDAQDIVKYLMKEHGCILLFKTLRRRTSEYSL